MKFSKIIEDENQKNEIRNNCAPCPVLVTSMTWEGAW